MTGGEECMICKNMVLEKYPEIPKFRKYLRLDYYVYRIQNDRCPFFSTFLGDSDGVDLTLFLLFESNTVYSKSLPDFNFYKQNFPHLWNDDLLEILPLEQNQKYQYIRRLEENAYESLRKEFEKIGRRIKIGKFLWARNANIL